MRRNYEMSESQLEKLLQARRPIPLIMLQCGMPRSPQERANDAWAELGAELGFDHMTAKPSGAGDRFFTAEPKESE